jgi:hypothetical protein
VKVALVVGAIVVVPLVGGVLLYRGCSGGTNGDRCEDGMACKPGLLCVGKKCAATCTSNADCPSGFRCWPFEVRDKTFGGKQTPIGPTKACIRH